MIKPADDEGVVQQNGGTAEPASAGQMGVAVWWVPSVPGYLVTACVGGREAHEALVKPFGEGK